MAYNKYSMIVKAWIIFLFICSQFVFAKVSLPSTKIKGNIGECVYNALYPTVGKIAGEYTLANGIDHINVVRDATGVIKKCTITDSKFGNATLGKVMNPKTGIKDIMQMSDEWILSNLSKLETMDLTKSNLDQRTKNKIEKARRNGEYKRLMGLVRSGVCKKRLFNVKFHPDGSVNTGYSEVINDGKGKVRTKPLKSDKHANRLINPTKKLSEKDAKRLESIYDCTAKNLCPKNDFSCISKLKKDLYKNPKNINSLIEKHSGDKLPKKKGLKQEGAKANKQKRIASASRKASTSVMTENLKSSKTSVVKKPTLKPKLSKVSASAAKSAAKRGVAKGVASGIGQYIPYVGIATQVAWDAYLGYKIEMHDEQIANNEQNIQLNREYIENVEKRAQQEQAILNTKVSVNSANIVLNMQKIANNSEQLAALEKGLSTVIWQVSNVQVLAEKNQQDIQAVKDGVFITGVQKLNEYYEGNKTDSDYLDEAITELDKTKNIKNSTVEALADYYLIIARYENYLTENKSHEFDKMKDNYDKLAEIVLRDPSSIGLLNSAYIAISDLSSDKLVYFKERLQTVTNAIISKKIKNAKFDEALDMAQNYIQVVDTDDTDTIYQTALRAKQENFNRFKNFTSVSNTLKVVEESQNTLLNEEAIRFLAKEKSMENALELLRTKRLDSESFRMKGFVCIYNYLSDKEMVEKIQKMVKENPTYSQTVRDMVLNLDCARKVED